MRYIVMALLLPFAAHADEWRGKDKGQHFVAGAIIASATSLATSNEGYGFLAGTAAGLAKEVYDGRRASAKDFLVTAAGAYVGAKVGGLFITPSSITYTLSF